MELLEKGKQDEWAMIARCSGTRRYPGCGAKWRIRQNDLWAMKGKKTPHYYMVFHCGECHCMTSVTVPLHIQHRVIGHRMQKDLWEDEEPSVITVPSQETTPEAEQK